MAKGQICKASGCAFNQAYSNKIWVKLTTKTERQFNNYTYVDGLNTDPTFRENCTCNCTGTSTGPVALCKGLHFVPIERFMDHVDGAYFMRVVTIPDAARTCSNGIEFKSDMLECGLRYPIAEHPELIKFFRSILGNGDGRDLKIIAKYPILLQCVTRPTAKFLISVIKMNPMYLEHIDPIHRTPEICHQAVTSNYRAIRFVEHPSLKMFQHVVQFEPSIIARAGAFQHIESLCVAAIMHDWRFIKLIEPEFMTKDVCFTAIKLNWKAIILIPMERRTREMYQMVLKLSKACSIRDRSLLIEHVSAHQEVVLKNSQMAIVV